MWTHTGFAQRIVFGLDVVGRAGDIVKDAGGASGCPGRRSGVGVTSEDVDAVVRMSSGNANVAQDPRPVSEDDARAILMSAF